MFFKPKTCLLCIAYTGVTYVRWKTSQSNNVHRFVWINIARIVRLGNYVNFLFTSCVCFPSPTPFSPSPFSPFNTYHFLSRVLSPMKCRCRAPPFVCLFVCLHLFVCLCFYLLDCFVCLYLFVTLPTRAICPSLPLPDTDLCLPLTPPITTSLPTQVVHLPHHPLSHYTNYPLSVLSLTHPQLMPHP